MGRWEQSISSAILRSRSLFRRGQMNRDLSEEFQYHLDRKTDELVEAGVPLPEARRAAQIALGGVEQAKEECRDAWGLRWLHELGQDIRYGTRLLRKSPGFALSAICMLGTAIGAIAIVFSLVDSTLLRPLPFRAPSELVVLSQQFPNQKLSDVPFSAAEVADLRDQTRTLADAAAFRYAEFNVVDDDSAERVIAAGVTPNLFDLLGVAPLLGRTFNSSDDHTRPERAVVISETLWRRRFAADSAIAGKQIRLSGRPCIVVGVMPEQFRFPLPRFNLRGPVPGAAEIWTPTRVSPQEMNTRSDRTFYVVGRMGNNFKFSDLAADLKRLGDDWTKRFPEVYRETNFGVVGETLHEAVTGRIKPALWILAWAVVAVLVIALFNLTAILLARGVGRRGEFALRTALGAGRIRICRQLITEGLLLTSLATAVGLALAGIVLPILRSTAAQVAPVLIEARISGSVLLGVAVTGLLAGVSLGIVPAVATGFGSPSGALQNRPQNSPHARRWNGIRDVLVIGEIALGLVLFFCAISLFKDFSRLRRADLGFDPTNVLTMEISVPPAKYPDDAAVVAYFSKATDLAKAVPDVQAAAFASVLPLSGANQDSSFTIEGAENSRLRPDEEFRVITPEYFRVLAIALRSGRVFTEQDNLSAPPVVIINDALAQRYWPGAEALGKRIRLNHWTDPNRWMEVVGIVGNIRHKGIDQPALPEFYLPHAQQPVRLMSMLARTSESPARTEAAIRRELRGLDPEQPVANVRPLRAVIGNSIAPQRLAAAFVGIFAIVALALGVIGLYSVMSFHFAERKAEIAMRLALGADRHQIVRLILRRTLRLVALGGAIGCAFIPTATNSLAGAQVLDARTFLVSLLAFLAVGFGAALIPAFRVTRASHSLSSRFC